MVTNSLDLKVRKFYWKSRNKLERIYRKYQQRILNWIINKLGFIFKSPSIKSSFFTTIQDKFAFAMIGEVAFVLHRQDLAISRRIYAGNGLEHLKAVKAIKIIENEFRNSRDAGEEKLKWQANLLIDIGANIGNICIPLVKQKLFERAICFEPDPANFKLLKVNTILNDLVDSMVLANAALGGEPDQELEFELSPENFGDHRVRVSNQPGIEKEESRPVIKVNSTTLDAFFAENDHGSLEGALIWIDVQGYEGLVLKGAKDTLATGVPLVIEFWPYGLKRADTFEFLFEALRLYPFYIDLGQKEILKRDLTELEILYSTYLNDASFMMDILILMD